LESKSLGVEPNASTGQFASEPQDGAPADATARPQGQTDPLTEARSAYKLGDWARVLDEAARCLRSRSDDREALQLSARAAGRLRRWDDAAGAWRKVIALRADHAEAWYQLGHALLKIKQTNQAFDSLDRLEELGGSSNKALNYAGRLALEMRQFARAAATLNRLATLDPTVLEADVTQMDGKRDLRESVLIMSAIAAAEPAKAQPIGLQAATDALMRRAIMGEQAGSLLEAYQDYTAVSLAAPADVLASRSTARTLARLKHQAAGLLRVGDLEAAAQLSEQLLECEAQDPQLLQNLARIHMKREAWPDAQRVLDAYTRLFPDELDPAVQRARALERGDCPIEALAAWAKVATLNPGHEEAGRSITRLPAKIVKLGRTAMAGEDLPLAIKAFAAVPEGAEQHADAQRRLSQARRHLYKQMRDTYKARDYSAAAKLGASTLVFDDNAADFLSLLAKSALKIRDYAVALGAFERLLVADPDNASAIRTQIAGCNLQLGRYDEANSELALARSFAPVRRN
jgi:tetratricopeptide (TPR) repeat protein